MSMDIPSRTHRLKAWLKEPLLHFFLLGGLLFGMYDYLHRNAPSDGNTIVISRDQFASIEAQHQALWGRPPNAQELNGLVEDWLHDEVLYREGVAMGLDRDDPIVRRRVEQKMEFIGDGNTPPPPTDADLQAWLDAHPNDYRTEAVFTLHQVYFDRAARGQHLDQDVAQAREALQQGKPVNGDVTSLPPAMTSVSGSEVTAIFGTEFEHAMASLPVGTWQGPVDSGLGVHLVKIDARSPGKVPPLADIRAAVERDVAHQREVAAQDAFYRTIRQRYVVRMEGDAPAPSTSSKAASRSAVATQ
jgi:hypothetical protein